MARRDIEFSEDSFYHIYNRGVGRQSIFLNADNYGFVMRKVAFYSTELTAKIVACCLMPNHYHTEFFGSPSGYEKFVHGYQGITKNGEKLKEYLLDE